ncbi:tyrosine-protein kinase JAK2-like [Coregonus clupeaformis]|uniref:tyrosine-protein kinase JAK2-like n=1 Tax=Coregonus clupeaformis TaxID=59861 RepID=UPI001BDFC415|nr:tyrosine-protein kinase JAK2-like [Coregonus clupeaformis]
MPSRSDFVACQAGVSPPLSYQEECLGLAVLDLCRLAKERNQSVREVCKTVSYKSCLPETHRQEIQQLSRLARYRIRNTLKRFLKKLGCCLVGELSLKLKYLMELAGVEPSHGTETFQVNHPGSQLQQKEPTFSLLRVAGESGIQINGCHCPADVLEWQTFCDFPEIIDISIKRACHEQVPQDSRVVTVTRQDDRCLEEKNIIHGNICAKNLLLAREGDASQGSSPFIKLSDPGINVAMLGRDVVLDRIPWVAPEVLEAPERLELECDKWSFGATLWEIFNGGKAPLQGLDLERKLQFYETYKQLPSSEWTELADLISQCMNYKPAFRPSCRSIIRQLNSLITSDYVILHAAEALPDGDSFWRALSPSHPQDQSVYEERHLRYISPLGKGNFGSVELCRYDPLGDNTGELIAVKKLQPNKQSNLDDFQKEINTIRSLHCDYIVKYRGVCYSMGRLSMSLVMEYLPYGSLIGYLEKNRQHVNSRRMLLFASQICKGLEYLQSMRYVHRDLAARNILVASDTLVKIADFGLTKIIPFDKEYYRVTHPGESPIFWYAPESITESKFSHKSDVWSFGVVLHELFSYCEHNSNPKRLYMQEIGNDMQGPSISMHLVDILKDNWRLPAPPYCLSRVYSMMMRCWAYCAEERPTFSTLGDQIETSIQDEREGSKG